MPVLESPKSTFLSASGLLFARCPRCRAFLVWRHCGAMLAATCSGLIFHAVPIDSTARTFHVSFGQADLRNVLVFERTRKGTRR